MEAVYPVQPVIPESEIRSYIQAMDADQDARSFIYAFGGCTVNLARYGDKRTEEVLQTIESLMNHSIELLRPPYAGYRSSVMRAMQSMFLHNCLMSMQASEAAFHYMRDSISTVQLLRIDNPDVMSALPSYERARRQRLYWQAYIHERFLAILDYRQAILPPLIQLPENDATIPLSVHEGFTQIIKLFLLLDAEFLKNWLGTHNQVPGTVTTSWIEAKSTELEDSPSTSDPDDPSKDPLEHLSTMQRADLTLTREWLRTLIWRLAMSQALLSSRSNKQCLTLLFPVRLSQSLRHLISTLSRQDIEVHGSGIVQKLFEITDTIADVLIHVPASSITETAQRIDDFVFILDFVVTFPTLDATRRGILLEKLERLRGMFPEVVSNASSPMMMDDGRSPQSMGMDPWGHMAQSKIAPGGLGDGNEMVFGEGEWAKSPYVYPASPLHGQVQMQAPMSPRFGATANNFENAGLGVTVSGGGGVGGGSGSGRGTLTGQKAAWNHIHRRLSTVQFPG
ncbi:hypothetical protein P154DRAFT_486665 [Amniculicola lignicola CBS 123094]|uniref:Transcription factor domain-containing protein n=1 Tax=Amniculicola lignicola CBS 123094 TaxID=1392246 RepID=A0A6A5WTC3_9PLEO|nr:hypothetical protein P154DRAFT_486665 [Amniculicola lignicola CBS 123094]